MWVDCSFNLQDFFSKEALVAAGGGTGEGVGGDWPSSDSEDDDYDPEAGEKRGNSEEENEIKEGGDDDRPDSEDEEDSDYMEDGEGREGGEDREGGENDEDSDSGSDFRENKESSGSSDKDEQEPTNITNLKKLARKGKRRRSSSSSSKEESASSDSSDSDASDVSFFDEFKDGGPKLGSRRRDSQAQPSALEEEALVIEGKRQRQALDYKRLHDVSLNEVHAHIMLSPSSFDEYTRQPNFGSELLGLISV